MALDRISKPSSLLSSLPDKPSDPKPSAAAEITAKAFLNGFLDQIFAKLGIHSSRIPPQFAFNRLFPFSRQIDDVRRQSFVLSSVPGKLDLKGCYGRICETIGTDGLPVSLYERAERTILGKV